MSRCFPFPPPGYEKKTRPDEDANLLIKEDPREKTKKKDKKDKEKKEKKERREKDKEKSSEKHREKKEKKHRHKDKEKSRDKEEKKTSEEKRIGALSDHQNSEKFGLTGLQVGETQNSRLLLDLGKKDRNDNGAKEMQILERITIRDLTSPGKVLEQQTSVLDDGNKKFKDKREENRIPNGQTVKINTIAFANGFVHNFPPKDQKNIEGSFYQEDKVTVKEKEQKDTKKHKDTDGRGEKDGEKKSKLKDKNRKREKKAEELSSLMPGKLGENNNDALDFKNDKGLYLFKETNVQNGILRKRKEPEMDGLVNGHEIQNNKLPRLASSSHQVVQTGITVKSSSIGNQFNLEKEATLQKHKSHAKFSSSVSLLENGRKLEMTEIPINSTSERQEAVSKHGKASDSLSSLKPPLGRGRNLESCQAVRSYTELEQRVVTNNTKDKKVLSMQPVAENGGKLGSSQFNNLNGAERQAGTCNSKLSEKGSWSNGFVVPKLNETASKLNALVELKKPSSCSMDLSSPRLEHREIVEKYTKPPHPDAKYLSQVLSVPKVEWSDGDEQKWLFGRKDHQAMNSKYVSPVIEEKEQVWAEALRIESADVIVLPYVIPY